MIKYLPLLLFFSSVHAQTPDWVKGQGKSPQYSETIFLTGYGVATTDNGVARTQAEESAIANARKNLVEKIRINIQSVTSSKTEEVGDQYSSFFASAVQSTSSLDIQGLETASYFDDDTKYVRRTLRASHIAHAFVFVKRELLQNTYQQKVTSLKTEIEGKITLAKSFEQQSKSTQALEEYLSCYPMARQLEEAQSILTFVKISNALDELQQTASTNEVTIAQIRQAVTTLVQRPINTVDDLAWFLIYQLKEQTGSKESERLSVLATPLVYQDTKMGSSFSRYFQQVMEQKLREVAKWDAVQQASAPFVVSGSYWEQNNNVKFIVNVRNVKDGRIIASAEATVPSTVIALANRSLTPENYKSALADQKVFASNEIAGGGLTLESWTSKETQGNLFSEGEKMKVLVRINMPCYIRFIYHMADGKRVLLLNEYFMDASKVNVVYEIPQDFECAAPFGSEVLQIFARTDKFEQIQTLNKDGYEYLKEDLKNFVVTTRGMKTAKPKTMQTEQRITITTMKD